MTIYTKGQTVEFIERVFGAGKFSNGGLNVSVSCPECVASSPLGYSKKKLVIRTDNFLVHCWRCGFKARNLVSVLRKHHPAKLPEYINTFLQGEALTNIEDKDLQPEENVVSLPEGFELVVLSSNTDAKRVRRYLANKRGISYEGDLWYWKFAISTEDEDLMDRVIVPSFDKEGTLNYWTARTTKYGQRPKYVNPPVNRQRVIFNEINIDWSQPLTLVEGVFDVMKCNQNATCLLGSVLDTNYVLFGRIVENQTPIVLALDADAKTKTLKIAKLLTEHDVPVRIVWVPETRGDVGAMTREEFKRLYHQAEIYNSSTHLLQQIQLISE